MRPPETRRRICPWRNVFVALIENAVCKALYIYTVFTPGCQLKCSGFLCSLARLAAPPARGKWTMMSFCTKSLTRRPRCSGCAAGLPEKEPAMTNERKPKKPREQYRLRAVDPRKLCHRPLGL